MRCLLIVFSAPDFAGVRAGRGRARLTTTTAKTGTKTV